MEKMKQYVASGGVTESPGQPKQSSYSRYLWIGLLIAILLLVLGSSLISRTYDSAGISPRALIETRMNTDQAEERLEPSAYQLTMNAVPIADTRIEFTVFTNAPVPIEVMASVSLAGQLDHETWIGEQRKVTLDNQTTSFILDTTSNGKRLPAGQYEAEVSYHARWGAANNQRAENVPNMSASQNIILSGSGETAERARERVRVQRWVLVEMDISRPWSDAELQARLGRFESYESPNAVRSMIYYFPDADVSLFIDPARGKVFTYELGRAY